MISIGFVTGFHIVCDGYTSEYVHFTFSNTIKPLSLSSNSRTDIMTLVETVSYRKMFGKSCIYWKHITPSGSRCYRHNDDSYHDNRDLFLDLPRQWGLWWAFGCLWAFWARRFRQVWSHLIWTSNICWHKYLHACNWTKLYLSLDLEKKKSASLSFYFFAHNQNAGSLATCSATWAHPDFFFRIIFQIFCQNCFYFRLLPPLPPAPPPGAHPDSGPLLPIPPEIRPTLVKYRS